MVDIKFHIERFVSSYPSLYSAYLCFRRHRTDAIVTKKTVMCLEGFPRSANSFSLHLIRGALLMHHPLFFSTHAEHLAAHHTHKIATLKASVRFEIPTLVLLRDPREAIPSSIVKESSMSDADMTIRKISRRTLKKYCDFYSYVDEKNSIKVVKFQTVINSPEKLISLTFKEIGLKIPNNIRTNEITEFAKRSIEYWDKKQFNHNFKTRTLPSEKKEKRKNIVLEKLECDFTDRLRRTVELYEKVNKRAVV